MEVADGKVVQVPFTPTVIREPVVGEPTIVDDAPLETAGATARHA